MESLDIKTIQILTQALSGIKTDLQAVASWPRLSAETA
jgi:hypothetical protein